MVMCVGYDLRARNNEELGFVPVTLTLNCPYLLSSKTNAKRTGLEKLAEKEDIVELDSRLAM